MKILVIDDEPKLNRLLSKALEDDGHDVHSSSGRVEAAPRIEAERFDLVITDLKMEEDESGIEMIRTVKKVAPETHVILMTGYATIEVGARALELGAHDYLIKPIKIVDLKARVSELARRRNGSDQATPEGPGGTLVFDNIVVGTNPRMQQIYQMLPRIVRTDSTVLVRGESGTGKEVIARAIHDASARKNGPFIEVNCAALVDSLLESELFGIEKRVATGVDRREGKFEQAEGGTLFLDEIGDMSLATQAKVLRAMQSKRIERVGGQETVSVDVRIIAATHVDLETAVTEKRFREDLFYRLNVVSLELPSLRERAEDIPTFVEHFRKRFNTEFGRSVRGVDAEALAVLQSSPWPGNVRQLRNAIERAFLMSRDDVLHVEDLPEQITGLAPATENGFRFRLPAEGISLEEVEREFILQALQQTKGNRTKAAELLGLTRRVLGYRLEKYGISGEEDPKRSEARAE